LIVLNYEWCNRLIRLIALPELIEDPKDMESEPKSIVNMEYIEYGIISIGDIFPIPAANNICAAKGIKP
jgi:hypothetical protein